MLRIAVSQVNPTVGDFDGNLALMDADARRAHAARADLVAFPELTTTGYYPGDLLEDDAFIARSDAAIERVKALSAELQGLALVVGCPRPNAGPGKRLCNALVVVRNGAIEAEYAKQLLPTYNVFDERRHFEPGPAAACIVRFNGYRVAFMICEDGWNDEGRDYVANPFDLIRRAGADVVVSINASPSNLGKVAQRDRVFGSASKHHGLPLVFVNQVGGQDQLVFDGSSFAAQPAEGVVFRAKSFATDFQVLGFDAGRFVPLAEAWEAQPEPADSEFVRRQVVLGLKDYARRCGFAKAVVGCSGGIDSALTLVLAVEALGATNVTAITMPSAFSSEGSITDSVDLCRALGISLYEHPIGYIVDDFAGGFKATFDAPLQGVALENLQARIRGAILMEYSNSHGHLLLTTGNKSEISVGYCTLYGDTCGGLGLIGDLYKTEIYALCRHLNEACGHAVIPQAILDKEPSAELAPGQKDTDSLPPYPVLDAILKCHIEGALLRDAEGSAAEATVAGLAANAEGKALLARIHGMVARNEYKRRQAPPIVRVRAKAFGIGRQMPIAARYA